MGLTLEFITGDVELISTSVREAELGRLNDPKVVKMRSDFSMHLIPNDLNSLSLEVGIITREEPLLLRPYLKPIIDEIDHGLLLVDPLWVEYISHLPLEKSEMLAENWFAEMRKDYNDPEMGLTEFGNQAFRDLLVFCKHAVENNAQVLHYWQE